MFSEAVRFFPASTEERQFVRSFGVKSGPENGSGAERVETGAMSSYAVTSYDQII